MDIDSFRDLVLRRFNQGWSISFQLSHAVVRWAEKAVEENYQGSEGWYVGP
jgi:hypothetical protein